MLTQPDKLVVFHHDFIQMNLNTSNHLYIFCRRFVQLQARPLRDLGRDWDLGAGGVANKMLL